MFSSRQCSLSFPPLPFVGSSPHSRVARMLLSSTKKSGCPSNSTSVQENLAKMTFSPAPAPFASGPAAITSPNTTAALSSLAEPGSTRPPDVTPVLSSGFTSRRVPSGAIAASFAGAAAAEARTWRRENGVARDVRIVAQACMACWIVSWVPQKGRMRSKASSVRVTKRAEHVNATKCLALQRRSCPFRRLRLKISISIEVGSRSGGDGIEIFPPRGEGRAPWVGERDECRIERRPEREGSGIQRG